MIELKNLQKTFAIKNDQVLALDGINLKIREGGICGVIGKSGAGKSTLVRCVNLLERPDSGEVIVDGQALQKLSNAQLRQVRHKIGMVFQHFNLLNSRNVFDNVAFPLELLHTPKAKIRKIVEEVLSLVGLQDRLHAYPAQLSGGQKQRVAIARALATQPKVLLCDEMTSALDPQTTSSILALLKKINSRMQLTILLITHEMDVIKQVCDTVAVIDQGRIVEQGKVLDIFCQPQHEITRALTRAAFNLKLPESLQNKVTQQFAEDAYTLLRISFVGGVTSTPLINDLINRFHLEINILQSDIETLHGKTVGMMMVAVRAKAEKMTAALDYLDSLGLTEEVLGYVAVDDWHFS